MTSIQPKTYVTIGGVNVTSYVGDWRIPERVSVIVEEASLTLSKSVDDVLTLANEQEVIIKRGQTTGQESTIFRGFLKMYKPRAVFYEVIAENKLGLLARRKVSNTYDKDNDSFAGVLSAIAEDLIESYGGLTASVVDSSTYSNPITIYPCNRDQVLERIDKLREVLDWVLREDHENDVVIFEPKGNTVYSVTLRYNKDGISNILNIPDWEYDSETMVNEVEIIGKTLIGSKSQTFAATASQTTFTLSETPGQTKVTVDGTEKTLGVAGSTSSYDYTMKQHLKQVIFEVAMSGGESVVVEYGNFRPISVTIQDAESIDTYCPTDPVSGEKNPFQGTFYAEDVLTRDDGEVRAEEILNHYAFPLKSAALEVPAEDEIIRAGYKIKVEDDVNNISDFFTVLEVIHQWPMPFDVVHVGQERVFEKTTLNAIEERLRKLEKRELQEIDLVFLRRDLTADLRVHATNEVYKRDTSYDGAWGKGFGDGTTKNDYTWAEQGGEWQSAYTNEPALHSVVHQFDQYEEDFGDDFFVDSTNTTATLNTTTHEVTF